MILPNGSRPSNERSSPLDRHTTLRVGGPADELVFPETVEHVQDILQRAAVTATPWRVLGRGSNLVVADEGVRGIVIHTGLLRHIRFLGDGRVAAGAGLHTSVLFNEALKAGLGGLEALVGYPASVGGAARMNAGGAWGETGARVESVVAVAAGGEVVELDAEQCRFAYRGSALGGMVVAEVVFRLPEVVPHEYRERTHAIYRAKKGAQPLGMPSAGCMFKNPRRGMSAGRIIDECGLKGVARGGAMVSQLHGNFVVNRGGATCDDVLRLVDHVRWQVQRIQGISLELEVEVWGRDHVPTHA